MSPSAPSSMCLRCLSRSINRVEVFNGSSRSSFSTTSSLAANPIKKKPSVAGSSSRTGKTLRLTKNKRAANARPPAVGERKALRKKVVLSNVNALEVQGLQDLNRDNIGKERLQALQQQVVGLKEETVDALRALEAFKPGQGWSLFRRPATLVRRETVQLAEDLDWVSEKPEEGRVVRKIVCGAQSSGKSVVQLQALAMASLKKWIIIHVPEAKDLTNAQTAYQPLKEADGKTVYVQPTFTAKLLESIVNANQAVLSKLRLSQKHDLPMAIQENISLDRFLDLGAKDAELAYPIWRAFLKELRTPAGAGEGLTRPPILFTMDGVDHTMHLSAYLDAKVQPIHAHDLALVRDFNRLLAGQTNDLPNGGMILAATTATSRAPSPTLDHHLALTLSKQGEGDAPARDPYFVYDERVEKVMATVKVMKLQGLSKAEARGIMEYYARSGMLRTAVTDRLVGEKWTLSGGGIVGQIEKATVRARF